MFSVLAASPFGKAFRWCVMRNFLIPGLLSLWLLFVSGGNLGAGFWCATPAFGVDSVSKGLHALKRWPGNQEYRAEMTKKNLRLEIELGISAEGTQNLFMKLGKNLDLYRAKIYEYWANWANTRGAGTLILLGLAGLFTFGGLVATVDDKNTGMFVNLTDLLLTMLTLIVPLVALPLIASINVGEENNFLNYCTWFATIALFLGVGKATFTYAKSGDQDDYFMTFPCFLSGKYIFTGVYLASLLAAGASALALGSTILFFLLLKICRCRMKFVSLANHFGGHGYSHEFVMCALDAWSSSSHKYKLGQMYAQGRGVPQNKDKALKCYQIAAEQGNSYAERTIEALALKPRAEQGDAEAQFKLGEMFAGRLGLAQGLGLATEESQEAIKWFQKAADQGHAEARQAQEKFEIELRAEQGDAEAQYKLGEMFAQGLGLDGLDMDDIQSMEWFQKAAVQGHAKAQRYLAVIIEQIMKGAEQGDADDQYKLGTMFSYGIGLVKDEPAGLKWYHKAAVQGHEKARDILISKKLDKESAAKRRRRNAQELARRLQQQKFQARDRLERQKQEKEEKKEKALKEAESKPKPVIYVKGKIYDDYSVPMGLRKNLGFFDGRSIREAGRPFNEELCRIENGKNVVVRGKILFNVAKGNVYEGPNTFVRKIGRVRDFPVRGMDKELDAVMVAVYHFFVKKII